MRFVIVYLSTLVVMLPLDFAFLGTIGKKLFAANVSDMVLDTPRLPPAVLFYALYLAGVVIFVNGSAPSNWTQNLLYGALFGFFCYATFELTNMSLLKQLGMGGRRPGHLVGRRHDRHRRLRRRIARQLDHRTRRVTQL